MTDVTTLKLRPREEYSIERFKVGSNASLFDQLCSDGNTWLHGQKAVGKTHVVYAVCRESQNSLVVDSVDYDFDGLDQFSLIVFDGIEQWLGERGSELEILGVYERLQNFRGRMIVTADTPVPSTEFALKDLQSRMRSFNSIELLPLPRQERLDLLRERATERGIELSDEVLNFMFTRMARSQAELLEALEILDDESIVHHRRITIPFVKQAFNL